MKILLYCASLAAGGTQRRLSELIEALSENPTIQLELVIMNPEIHYKKVLDKELPIHYLIRKNKKDISIYLQLYKLCKKIKPDILHCWDSMTAIYSAPVCRLLNIKLINGMIVDAPVKQTIFNRFLLRARLTFPFSTIIVGNSNAGLMAYNSPKDKSICIYNGIDLSRFEVIIPADIVKQRLGLCLSKEEFVIGMVAAFEDRKDYDSLINVAIKLTIEKKNIYFILVGGGYNFDKIKNKVPQMLQKQILFLGIRHDIESIVNIFDIGILLTNTDVHGEGISNSILEYMALSKPVIATNGGGTSEVIINGYNGFLIKHRDEPMLLEKLYALISNKELRSTLGANGYKLIIDKFDIQIMTRNYLNLYETVLKQSN